MLVGCGGGCRHACPNSRASRTPSHDSAGTGAFQRNSPTGGLAYGMPLNAATSDPASATPCKAPVRTRTCGRDSPAPRAGPAAVAAARHSDTRAAHPRPRPNQPMTSGVPIYADSKLVAEPHAKRPRPQNRVTTVDERFGVDVHDAV